MKKIALILLAALLILTVLPVHAVEPDIPYVARDLFFTMSLDASWLELIQSGKLSLWRRADEDAKVDGMRGYLFVYNTPDLAGLPRSTYPLAEAWLNENAQLLLGVAVHDSDLPDTFYPELKRDELGNAGDATFTLMRASKPADEPYAGIWTALSDPNRFVLSDPALDPGLLGEFDTNDIVTGESITHETLKQAKMTIVNFWGTFCPPCIEEMPAMGKLAAEYSEKGVQFLGVVTDLNDANALDLANEIIEKTGAHYMHIPPVVDRELMSTIMYIPTTYFLDENGQQIGERIVSSMDETGWRNAIESRLRMINE